MEITRKSLGAVLAFAATLTQGAAAQIDLTPRPIERLAEADFTPEALPNGYSHVVMLAWPRLTQDIEKETPGMAAKFAQLFGSAILADVRQTPQGGYKLNRLAMGHVMRTERGLKVVNGQSEVLTFLERQVISSGEKELDKVKQIARYDTAILFETPATMLRNGRHEVMKLRQFVWTSARQGGLASALWLVDVSNPHAPRVADAYFVQLPAGYVDDRLLSVDREQFNFVGMPSPTAFALARLPQGQEIPFTPELSRMAAAPVYTRETLPQLAQQLALAISSQTTSAVGAR